MALPRKKTPEPDRCKQNLELSKILLHTGGYRKLNGEDFVGKKVRFRRIVCSIAAVLLLLTGLYHVFF